MKSPFSIFHFQFLLLLLLLPLTILAETKETREANRHEVRIGVGDAVMGQLGFTGWYEEPLWDWVPPDPNRGFGTPTEDYHAYLMKEQLYFAPRHVLPHFFVGYQYRFNSWFGFGFQFDFSGEYEHYTVHNGYGEYIRSGYTHTLDWALIPEARFTYFHREKVNLFSTLGLGAAMRTEWSPTLPQWGMEPIATEYEFSPALQGTLLGVSIGSGHWFGTVELGYQFEPVFGVLMHKMLSASFGYRL